MRYPFSWKLKKIERRATLKTRRKDLESTTLIKSNEQRHPLLRLLAQQRANNPGALIHYCTVNSEQSLCSFRILNLMSYLYCHVANRMQKYFAFPLQMNIKGV